MRLLIQIYVKSIEKVFSALSCGSEMGQFSNPGKNNVACIKTKMSNFFTFTM